jgi:hypothetical protein
MSHPLTRQEKLLIERELIALEETRVRRKTFFGRLFFVGISAALASAFLGAFFGRGLWAALFVLVWGICTLLYTEFLTIPQTFAKDANLTWHLNPWQEALQRLGADGRQVQGIILLAIFPTARLLFSFLALSIN